MIGFVNDWITWVALGAIAAAGAAMIFCLARWM